MKGEELVVLLNSRSKKNLLSGLLFQIINTIMGFILPYLFINNLGSEANGLLSSMAQLFIYLNLLEAGVGATSLQSLYKPISENNKEDINHKLSAASQHYLRTGVYYATAIIVFAFFYPYIVNSSLSDDTIRFVVLIQGCGSLLSYTIRSVYVTFLNAKGDIYVLNYIQLICSFFRQFGRIVALYLGCGILTVQIIHLFAVVLETTIIIGYVKYKYNWVSVRDKPDFSALKQKNAALLKTVTFLIFNRTDVMVLTFITRNLKLVSVYTLYSLIFEAGQNIVDVIMKSYQYKIGRMSQGNKDAFYDYYKQYRYILTMVVFGGFTILYLMVKPFISVYTANVTDINYVMIAVPELFFLVKLLYNIRGIQKQAVDAVGHFEQTKRISIKEMIINLTISISLAMFIDIRGVLIGTVISLLVSDVLYTGYVDINILSGKYDSAFLIQISLLSVVTAGIVFMDNSVLISVNNYWQLMGIGVIMSIQIGALYLLMTYGAYLYYKRTRI